MQRTSNTVHLFFGSALFLGGVVLIFFILACKLLCFGFVMKTVLVTQGCFSYC